MRTGYLYKVKEFHWLLFPSREILIKSLSIVRTHCISTFNSLHFNWNKCCDCEVNSMSPDDYFLLLESDRKYMKVLTNNGNIGWTLNKSYFNSFLEEIK